MSVYFFETKAATGLKNDKSDFLLLSSVLSFDVGQEQGSLDRRSRERIKCIHRIEKQLERQSDIGGRAG